MNNEEKILDLLHQVLTEQVTMRADLSTMKSDLSTVKSDLSTAKSDISTMQSDISTMKEDLVRVEVTQENIVIPQLQLLAEGHKALLEAMSPKSRVEALEDEIVFVKSVIKSLSQEVTKLSKAQ